MPPGSWWLHQVCPVLLLLTSVRAGTIAFQTGIVRATKASSSVSGITFSVTEGGTVALCDLSFDTDLNSIASAAVSCKTLYDSSGDQVVIGETSHSWTFYAEIGGSVYNVGATLLFSPATNTLSTLVLCVQAVCTDTAQQCLVFPDTSSSSSRASSFTCGIPPSSSSEPEGFPMPGLFPSSPSLRSSSDPEGFVIVLSSNPSESSPAQYSSPIVGIPAFSSSASASSSTPEGFVFNFGSTPESTSSGPSQQIQPSYSASVSSSTPEGFVFNFGSAGTSSSSGGDTAGTTTDATTGGTTAATEVQAGTTASTSTLV